MVLLLKKKRLRKNVVLVYANAYYIVKNWEIFKYIMLTGTHL